ncbi:Replication factor A [uncultured archaeon]|nr:Replication factor A [uncultured archaeon]
MDENCDQLVGFISEKSGVPKEEIERKIEAKQAKLAGLISKAGAAQIVAAELNVSFDRQTMKISQIAPGMKKINLIGKVINLFPIREYNKNGRSGRIGSFVLADETSNIRTVLWDENHIDLIEKGQILKESVIEIANATLRNGELHLTSFSEIKISDRSIDKVITDKPIVKKSINQFNANDNTSTRAFIVQMFEPRFFYVCPACKKKASESGECLTHGKVVVEKRALLNFVIDDGSDSIRAVMFSDQINKLMSSEELEPELFAVKKKDLLGKEVIITGQVRKNALYNNNEFIVSDIEEVNLDKLIAELEK